jgi:hypothetical protein
MADVSAALSDYLASLRLRRWSPGGLDCGVFVADWARQVCGRDPIADLRGTYASERQFLRILRREGGFVNSFTMRMSALGYVETATPQGGDVAVVLAPYLRNGSIARRPTGAICSGRDWRSVVTSDAGLVIARGALLPLVRAFHYA